MREELDQADVERHDRRHLGDGQPAAEEAPEDDHRDGQLPDGGHQGPGQPARLEGDALAGGMALARPRAVEGQDRHQEQARDDARQEERVHRDGGDVGGDQGVDDQRQGGREEQPQAAAGGDQTQVEALGVALPRQQREQEPPQGDDGDAAGAGEGGEEGAGDDGHQGRAPRHPAQRGPRELHQPLGRLAVREHEAGVREERDGHEDRVLGDLVEDLDEDHRRRQPHLGLAAEGDPQDHQEERQAQEGQQEEQQDQRQGHAAPPSPPEPSPPNPPSMGPSSPRPTTCIRSSRVRQTMMARATGRMSRTHHSRNSKPVSRKVK